MKIVNHATVFGLIASFCLTAQAQVVVRPRPIEVAPPRVEITPSTPSGLRVLETPPTLDALRVLVPSTVAGQNPETPVAQASSAQCDAAYIATLATDRVPSLRGQEPYIQKALADGILRPGGDGCGGGDGSFLQAENDKVAENVLETGIAIVRAGGLALGTNLDEVGAEALRQAKVNDGNGDPGPASVEDYQAVGNCWFLTEQRAGIQ